MSITRAGRVVAILGMMMNDVVLQDSFTGRYQFIEPNTPGSVVLAVACLFFELRKFVSVSLLFCTIRAKN